MRASLNFQSNATATHLTLIQEDASITNLSVMRASLTNATATHLILYLGLLHLMDKRAVEVPQDVGFGVALHLAEQRHLSLIHI